jgi:hypothetical protein
MDAPPPMPLGYASPPSTRASRPLDLIAIAATTMLAGMVVGASTNAINGAVSPNYFVNVMGWQGITDVWRASIVQGVLEGFVIEMILSILFTATVGIVTKATCPYRTSLRWLGAILAAVYILWAVGGLAGVALAAIDPQFFQTTFFGVPFGYWEMLRFAWVGGSIWGAEFGGLLAVIIGLVLIRANWRRMLERESGRGLNLRLN